MELLECPVLRNAVYIARFDAVAAISLRETDS